MTRCEPQESTPILVSKLRGVDGNRDISRSDRRNTEIEVLLRGTVDLEAQGRHCAEGDRKLGNAALRKRDGRSGCGIKSVW